MYHNYSIISLNQCMKHLIIIYIVIEILRNRETIVCQAINKKMSDFSSEQLEKYA